MAVQQAISLVLYSNQTVTQQKPGGMREWRYNEVSVYIISDKKLIVATYILEILGILTSILEVGNFKSTVKQKKTKKNPKTFLMWPAM